MKPLALSLVDAAVERALKMPNDQAQGERCQIGETSLQNKNEIHITHQFESHPALWMSLVQRVDSAANLCMPKPLSVEVASVGCSTWSAFLSKVSSRLLHATQSCQGT
jgi:hypothetical protein